MITTILNKMYDICEYLVYGEQTLDSLMCHPIKKNKLIDYLKKNPNEINKKDEFNVTPFMYAISSHKSPTIIKILLEYDADPSIIEPTYGFNSLHFAVNNLIQVGKYKLTKEDYIEIIKMIDKNNKDLMNQPDNNGITPANILSNYPLYFNEIFEGDAFVHVTLRS